MSSERSVTYVVDRTPGQGDVRLEGRIDTFGSSFSLKRLSANTKEELLAAAEKIRATTPKSGYK